MRTLAGAVPIFGGLGGVSLLQELDAGADGVMAGFGFPETLVEATLPSNEVAIDR